MALSPKHQRGRLLAVSLCLLLTSCTQGGGTTPMGDTLGSLWGPDEADISAQASALPYASISVDVRGNRGLLIMAYQGGEQGGHTFWQAGDETTLAFRNGRPFATAGLDADLLGYRVILDEASPSVVETHWLDEQGLDHQSPVRRQPPWHCR